MENNGKISSMKDLQSYMKRSEFCDGRCYVASVCFGEVTIRAYSIPSAIPYNAVGEAGRIGGFFQNGELKPFPKRQQIRYQNSATGCE